MLWCLLNWFSPSPPGAVPETYKCCLAVCCLIAWAGAALLFSSSHGAGAPSAKQVVLVVKTDEEVSLRAFFTRIGYKFLRNLEKEVKDLYAVACARSHPGGRFVGLVKPPLLEMPWPPPYICIHPNPFSEQEAELLCRMAGDHLGSPIKLLANRPAERTVVCGSAKAVM